MENMLKSGAQLLGPVARRLICTDRWTDEYPAWDDLGEELDSLLRFAGSQGRLSHFRPRLESRNTQRNAAVNELRVAYFLDQNGFPVKQWEPPGLNGRVGEYLVGSPQIFVEVKSPGWEGQLSDAARRAGRTMLPKYRNGEGGAFGNWQPLQQCIASEKTYPKFSPNQPNLLIVADDLKVSLSDSLDHVEVALYANHKLYGELGFFTSPRFCNLGGVGVFNTACYLEHRVEYRFAVFENPFALSAVKLPDSILKFKPPSYKRQLAVRI